MTYKPRFMQATDRPIHSPSLEAALQGAIAMRPAMRPPPSMRRPYTSDNISTSNIITPQVHTRAPSYSTIAISETSYSLGAPPPYSSCTERQILDYADLPPTYEEAIANTLIRAPQTSDSENSFLIRLHF